MPDNIVSKNYQGFVDWIGEVNKWGENIDVDTADAAAGQIIWPIKSTVQQYIFLDSPIQLFITSDDASDSPSGIGAKSIKLLNWQGLNGNFKDAITLPTAGLGTEPLPELSYGVFSMEVESSGSNNVNVGTIKIVDGSNNIYAVIEQGEGRTQIAVQRIPNDALGVVKYHKVDYARTGGNNDAQMRLKVRKTDGTIVTRWDPTLTTDNTDDTKVYSPDYGGISLNPGEWLYWECISVSANSTPIRGSFDIKIERA